MSLREKLGLTKITATVRDVLDRRRLVADVEENLKYASGAAKLNCINTAEDFIENAEKGAEKLAKKLPDGYSIEDEVKQIRSLYRVEVTASDT